MADLTDLERACDEMLKQQLDPDAEYWRAEYWLLKDEYDQMVSKLEELVRNYCG